MKQRGETNSGLGMDLWLRCSFLTIHPAWVFDAARLMLVVNGIPLVSSIASVLFPPREHKKREAHTLQDTNPRKDISEAGVKSSVGSVFKRSVRHELLV